MVLCGEMNGPNDRGQYEQRLEAQPGDEFLVAQRVVQQVTALTGHQRGRRDRGPGQRRRDGPGSLRAGGGDVAHEAAPCMPSRVLGSTLMYTRSMMKLARSTPMMMKMKMPWSRK